MAKHTMAVENYFQNVIKKSWTWEKLTEEEQKRAEQVLTFVPPLYPVTAQQLLRINQEDCVGCGICSRVCARGNFEFTGNGNDE